MPRLHLIATITMALTNLKNTQAGYGFELWLSQVEYGSHAAEEISELAPRAYAGHVHAAVSEERARKGGQEDGQTMRVT